MVTGRPHVTLAIGAQLERRGMAGRCERHRLNVASAHVALRQYPEAMAVLVQLRQAVPEWLACQRYAADILTGIVRRRRMLSPEMRDLAVFLNLAL